MMFGNKKSVLPPRPEPPKVEQILEDLNNSANKDDVAFKLLARESAYNDSTASAEVHDLNNVYEKVKTYLDVNKKLKILKDSIREDEEHLECNVKNITELTEEIKERAQAALIQ